MCSGLRGNIFSLSGEKYKRAMTQGQKIITIIKTFTNMFLGGVDLSSTNDEFRSLNNIVSLLDLEYDCTLVFVEILGIIVKQYDKSTEIPAMAEIYRINLANEGPLKTKKREQRRNIISIVEIAVITAVAVSLV
jgi:hypothetical protein